MEIKTTREQGHVQVTVFHITGSVDAASYEQLQNQAQAAVSGGARKLVLDLQRVPYMSSAGLRALNYIYNLVDGHPATASTMRAGVMSGKTKSANLKLLNPNPRVQQVLRMAGYDMFLEIHHSAQEAVASFQ